jgi:hypothetical protein
MTPLSSGRWRDRARERGPSLAEVIRPYVEKGRAEDACDRAGLYDRAARLSVQDEHHGIVCRFERLAIGRAIASASGDAVDGAHRWTVPQRDPALTCRADVASPVPPT